MCNHRIITAVILGLLAAAPLAKAGPQEDALLQQVKQMASQGQDAQTTAQVNQYVDQNKDVISSILKNYMEYLKQLQSVSTDGTAPTPSASPQAAQPPPAISGTQQNNVPQQPPAQVPETAQAIQMDTLQTSGELQTAHLPGYPSLPTVSPISAIQNPTAEQLNHAATLQKQMQDRKAYLMEHPEGYTY